MSTIFPTPQLEQNQYEKDVICIKTTIYITKYLKELALQLEKTLNICKLKKPATL